MQLAGDGAGSPLLGVIVAQDLRFDVRRRHHGARAPSDGVQGGRDDAGGGAGTPGGAAAGRSGRTSGSADRAAGAGRPGRRRRVWPSSRPAPADHRQAVRVNRDASLSVAAPASGPSGRHACGGHDGSPGSAAGLVSGDNQGGCHHPDCRATHIAIQRRRRTVLGEQRDLPTVRTVLVQRLDRTTPGSLLRIVDLTVVQHVPLHRSTARNPAVLHDAPVAVLLAVLPANLVAKKHAGRFRRPLVAPQDAWSAPQTLRRRPTKVAPSRSSTWRSANLQNSRDSGRVAKVGLETGRKEVHSLPFDGGGFGGGAGHKRICVARTALPRSPSSRSTPIRPPPRTAARPDPHPPHNCSAPSPRRSCPPASPRRSMSHWVIHALMYCRMVRVAVRSARFQHLARASHKRSCRSRAAGGSRVPVPPRPAEAGGGAAPHPRCAVSPPPPSSPPARGPSAAGARTGVRYPAAASITAATKSSVIAYTVATPGNGTAPSRPSQVASHA